MLSGALDGSVEGVSDVVGIWVDGFEEDADEEKIEVDEDSEKRDIVRLRAEVRDWEVMVWTLFIERFSEHGLN